LRCHAAPVRVISHGKLVDQDRMRTMAASSRRYNGI